MKVYTAPWVAPVAAPLLEDGAVAVEGGRIAAVGAPEEVRRRAQESFEEVRLDGCILLPGLVNVHCHLEYTVFRDLLDGAAYLDWIPELTRLKYAALDTEALLASARLGAWEALLAGTTTIGEQGERGAGIRAVTEAGLRGVCWLELFGRTRKAAREALARLDDRLAAARDEAGPRVRLGLTPHTPWTSGEDLLRATAERAAREDLALSIHVAESREETELLRTGRGPLARRLRLEEDWFPPGKSAVAWLDDLGFWEAPPPVQAVHLVQADGEDWEVLARNGASAALCPRSNLALGVGRAPVEAAARSGVATGLGTDSSASGGSLSPLSEARAALREARLAGSGPSAERVLAWLTIEGARSLGLDHRIGSLEPGKEADLVAFRLQSPRHVPVVDPVGALIQRTEPADLVLSMVAGEVLVEDGRLASGCGLAPETILEEAAEAGARLAREHRRGPPAEKGPAS